jgi:hypothetical protein
LGNIGSAPLLGQEGLLSLSESGDKGLSFLHFGCSLAGMAALIEHFGRRGKVWTTDFRKFLDSRSHADAKSRNEIADVLEFLTGNRRRKFPLELLAAELDRSVRWRTIVQSLGCRGFSFRLCEDPVFTDCSFSPDVSRKFALLADPGLYYPPNVRHALQATTGDARDRHVANSVGWMLVMEKNHSDRTWWYVINVQSDLMCSSESALKEQFRGWQRVLFWILIQTALRRGVAMIAFPSVDAVTSSCERRRAWRPLYDGLARSFGMRSVPNPYRTNIQPLLYSRDKNSPRFYVSSVRRLVTRAGTDNCGLLTRR